MSYLASPEKQEIISRSGRGGRIRKSLKGKAFLGRPTLKDYRNLN